MGLSHYLKHQSKNIEMSSEFSVFSCFSLDGETSLVTNWDGDDENDEINKVLLFNGVLQKKTEKNRAEIVPDGHF